MLPRFANRSAFRKAREAQQVTHMRWKGASTLTKTGNASGLPRRFLLDIVGTASGATWSKLALFKLEAQHVNEALGAVGTGF